ncbi:MAG TPA: electron transport complex subunit RsxC [Feifaniaceae bacterium]|nr:electron transport complex subunit RsxC [Feifaniaceae bacterium]
MPKLTFQGGVHPMHDVHGGKLPTKDLPVREFTADTVSILMGMHLGAPSSPCVQKGDYVRLGQLIGEPVGPLGLPVHASVSGTVIDVSPKQQLSSSSAVCVTIKNDHKDEWADGITGLGDVETVDPSLIVPAVKNAGICGMGGACFPTHVKLTVREGQYCDAIILNGAECETHLTADYRLMLEQSAKIVDGLRAAMRALNVKRGVIAIEDNKPEAIALMKKAAQGREGVEVAELKTKYPQGGEKQLIEAVTGREVPQKKLPLDAHVIVLNVGTAAAIAEAVTTGRPLVSRITTVTGCVNKPANLRLRVGTTFADAVQECGGYSKEPGKLIAGGAMTGIPASSGEVSMTKATNGIVVYSREEAKEFEENPCIRCARCVAACPAGLRPYLMKHYCEDGDLAAAEAENVMDCIVCGCCSYNCPARLRLTPAFKVAKDQILAAQRGGAKK